MTVKHATLTFERTYPVPPKRVFAAWADPEAKARWFAASASHELDFRVGGREIARGEGPDGRKLTFVGTYHDIVPDARILCVGMLSASDALCTVSLTTVEFFADGDGTRLVLIEQGTFLDDAEKPEWREQGIGEQLDRLAKEFQA
ncbi:MAG TPA: SRPBCC family protein [Amycolatopsis sp.]|nr:SRPBCC family protein [Amycolatopsis sp.]